jgi:antitoxin component of MazEF toxin-antitoxin module
MPIVEVAAGGNIKIPNKLVKKYRIRKGARINVSDENGVITIRPLLADCVRLARLTLK